MEIEYQNLFVFEKSDFGIGLPEGSYIYIIVLLESVIRVDSLDVQSICGSYTLCMGLLTFRYGLLLVIEFCKIYPPPPSWNWSNFVAWLFFSL